MGKDCYLFNSPEEVTIGLIQSICFVGGSLALMAHAKTRGNANQYNFSAYLLGLSTGFTGLVFGQIINCFEWNDSNLELAGLTMDQNSNYI